MLRKLLIGVVAALLLALPALASADPAPGGKAGSGVSAKLAVDNPVPDPVPVATNEQGAPMFMSQDGGDGEHASVAVSTGVRDLIQSGNYSNWNLSDFGEYGEATESQTVFHFKAGETWFRVEVTKGQPTP